MRIRFKREIERLNKNMKSLIEAHYRLISIFIPEVKPTKEEIKIFEERKREEVTSLKEIEKRIKNV